MSSAIGPGTYPAATLGDHARFGAAQRLAWSLGRERGGTTGRRTVTVSAVAAGAARRDRARASLLRLAADPAATPAERELARERAAQLEGCLV